MAKVVGFNYEIVANKTAATKAKDNAKQIRKLLEQSAVSVISIGRLMAEVKEGLTPTVFVAWVECEFGWVPSVATNYMQAARVFGDLDCLKQFQPSAICMLARKNIPEAVVKDAIQRARAGELITFSLVNKLLKEAGHKPTNPSAGRPRKPIVPTLKAEGATLVELRESVEALATNITKLSLEQADRESLANKFFELAMMLRLGPAAPATPAEAVTSGPKSTAPKATATASKATAAKPAAPKTSPKAEAATAKPVEPKTVAERSNAKARSKVSGEKSIAPKSTTAPTRGSESASAGSSRRSKREHATA